MLLKDAKIGDVVTISAESAGLDYNGYIASAPITGTVIKDALGGSEYSTVNIAWKTNEIRNVNCIIDMRYSPLPELTRGIVLIGKTPCTLVVKKAAKDKSIGLMFACIGAGAAMSHFFQDTNSRTTSSAKEIAQ